MESVFPLRRRVEEFAFGGVESGSDDGRGDSVIQSVEISMSRKSFYDMSRQLAQEGQTEGNYEWT